MMLKIPVYLIGFFFWMWLLLKALSLLTSQSDWLIAGGATMLLALVAVLGMGIEMLQEDF